MPNLVEKLTAIGDAIRAKTGGSDMLTLDEMPDEIASIKSGGFDFTQLSFVNNQTYADQYIFDTSLTTLDLTGIVIDKPFSLSNAFKKLINLQSVVLTGFDTSNVTNMSSMFSNCASLTSLDLTGFDTSNVTNMSGMFYNCASLTSLSTGAGWTYRSIQNNYNARFPVAMQDENGTQFASGDVIPEGAHTYTAVL